MAEPDQAGSSQMTRLRLCLFLLLWVYTVQCTLHSTYADLCQCRVARPQCRGRGTRPAQPSGWRPCRWTEPPFSSCSEAFLEGWGGGGSCVSLLYVQYQGAARYQPITVGQVISSEHQCQKIKLSITDMFMIDHKEKSPWLITKLFVIKQGLFFFVIYHKPFC